MIHKTWLYFGNERGKPILGNGSAEDPYKYWAWDPHVKRGYWVFADGRISSESCYDLDHRRQCDYQQVMLRTQDLDLRMDEGL